MFEDDEKYIITEEDIHNAELKIDDASGSINVEKVEENIREEKFNRIYGDFSQTAFAVAQNDHAEYYERIVNEFETSLDINKKSTYYDKIHASIVQFVEKYKKNSEDEFIYQSVIERFVRDVVEILIRRPYSSEARLNKFVDEAEVFSGLVMFYNTGDADEGYKRQFLSVEPKNQPLLLAFEKGNWAVFYDEQQNIYNPEYRDGMDLFEPYLCTRFKLFVNCRNTIQIGTYSAETSGVEIEQFLQENGEEVQKISYVDITKLKRQINDIIKNLRAEKVELRDVSFLSPKKYVNSILSKIGVKVNELGDYFDRSSDLPRFATIQGFKGLDSKIVILVDVDCIRTENFAKYIYIAGTRARTLLYVVAPKEEESAIL